MSVFRLKFVIPKLIQARYGLHAFLNGFSRFRVLHHFSLLTLVVKMMQKHAKTQKIDAKTRKHA